VRYADSISNEENTKKIVQAQMQYEFEKQESVMRLAQEKKDALAANEKKKQAIVRNVFMGGFVLVLFLALMIFRGYQNKKRDNDIIMLQKQEVEKSRELIALQKNMVEEKQKEIVDSIYYARRIQKALITNEKSIQKQMKRLKA
jgi:hypothetical protein